jgi:basic membrane lipoprotein Med (substrate-binding protein (PBP1-ABC) superfamily)
MDVQEQVAREEYLQALKKGLKEYRSSVNAGRSPYPKVLDEILKGKEPESIQEVGIVEVPVERIVGIRSAGRVTAFTRNFLPLLDEESEFSIKWRALCVAHLTEGIQEPILCYEYLGEFFVQEGNKRVSVLRHMGAARITAQVKRIQPPVSDKPRVLAYKEFLDFYKDSGLYYFLFRRPGGYSALRNHFNKRPGEKFTEDAQRTIGAYFHYFREAFEAVNDNRWDILPEEALLTWLQVYPFRELGKMSAQKLKKSLSALWEDVVAQAQPEPVQVRMDPMSTEGKPNVFARIITGTPERVNVAFIYSSDPEHSPWVQGHEEGRRHLELALGEQVTARCYYNGSTPKQAQELMEQAVADGANVVFTTTPQMSRPTVKVAVKYPEVRFLNCSVDTSYSSIRTYYSRIYEAKFITGAIAGAMANNDRIGYVGSSPIFGVPASINAFALGAQLTNPRARITLGWSCLPGSPQTDFLRNGVQVISNRDVPTPEKKYLDLCNYGTYAWNENGNMIALASPVWLWGKFYETVVRSILAGTWIKDKDSPRAVNYWWGMDSGVIDVEFADQIPEGVRTLAEILRKGLQNGTIEPFRRRIVAQGGIEINDGSRNLTPEEILHMDWLCENVEGHIPKFEEIEPFAQAIVRQLGVHRDRIAPEGRDPDENTDGIR